ncbi:hypothetical protein AA0113_g12023 [Alternaria arborescens]|uniref:Uncharacterized protein n=1 Tax=Alternaria arborescens TaxID=156630 RepID=A0A4Q4PZP7_9PLEO|nr:hypothetical protein AA0113_g12023 [Alternaria arborescens]
MHLMPFAVAGGMATTSFSPGPSKTATSTLVPPESSITTPPGVFSMPTPKLSLNMGHGPVVFSRTSATVPTSTYTPTVVERGTDLSLESTSREIRYVDEPRPKRNVHLHAAGELRDPRGYTEGIRSGQRPLLNS